MSNDNTTFGSIEELLEVFKTGPQTKNWDAIVAYDWLMTDRVLLQEYIARQSKDTLPDPITVDITQGTTQVYREWLIDYIPEAPTLRFQNANVAESKAMLSMRIFAGTRMSQEEVLGKWRNTKIGSHSPLTTPEVQAEINLMRTEGNVSNLGVVYLSIDEGQNYTISDADDAHTRKLLGAKIKEELAKWPKAKKEFVLSTIKIDPEDFIQPHFFLLRTHTTDEGRSRDSAQYGRGEVLLFITMKGGMNGTLPGTNKDQVYLVPDKYTATVVLGNRFMLRQIILKGCEEIVNMGKDFEVVVDAQDGDFVKKITVVNGARNIATPLTATDLPHFSRIHMPYMAFGLGKQDDDEFPGESSFHVEFANGELKVVWTGNKEQPFSITTKAGQEYSHNIGMHWAVTRFALFHLQESGDLEMIVDTTRGDTQLRVTPRLYVLHPDVSEHFREIADRVTVALKRELEAGIAAFMAPSRYINQFVLNQLLFQSDTPVKLERAHYPGDVLTVGELGQSIRAIDVTPLRTYVPVDGAVQFKAEPANAAIEWSLETIDETNGDDIGTIDGSGLYRAPKTMSASHIRVRVKASLGTTVVYAMVNVLSFFIDVAPQVQVIQAESSLGRELRAGALDAQVLEWKLKDPTTGSRIVKSELPDGDHTFFPGPLVSGKIFVTDEIVVTTTQAPITSVTSYVVVMHQTMNATILVVDDPSLPDEQVQLELWSDPAFPPDDPADFNWDVLLGAGTVDGNGLVTMDRTSPLPFVVVTVLHKSGRPNSGVGIILLPWPKFKVPALIRLMQS